MDAAALVRNVENIPPTPQLLPKLQKVIQDLDTGIDDIIALLRVDAPLTAQIVRMSNSVYYGSTSKVTNLEEAIQRVGFNQVYRLVGLAAAQQVMGPAVPFYRMAAGELWRRSVLTASLMIEFATLRRLHPDTAYTIGLLHGLGKVVINQYYIDRGIELYGDSDVDLPVHLMERRLLGFDHGVVGGELLKKWSFPPAVRVPVSHQFDPEKAPSHQDFTALLALCVPQAAPLANDEDPVGLDRPEVAAAAEIAQVDAPELDEVIAAVRERMDELRSLFA